MELERSGRAFDSLEDRKFLSSGCAGSHLEQRQHAFVGRKIAVPTTQATCRPTNAINSAPLSDKGDRAASVSSCSSLKNLPAAAEARASGRNRILTRSVAGELAIGDKKREEESIVSYFLQSCFSNLRLNCFKLQVTWTLFFFLCIVLGKDKYLLGSRIDSESVSNEMKWIFIILKGTVSIDWLYINVFNVTYLW